MSEFLKILWESTYIIGGVVLAVAAGIGVVIGVCWLVEEYPWVGILLTFAGVVLVVSIARYLGG